MPPRHPYTRPAYELGCCAHGLQLGSEASAAFTLVVGELLHTEGELRPVTQFIPPSTGAGQPPGAATGACISLTFSLPS